ncbi:SH3 domain-containing protein [Gemmobacter fulvus]|uniref:SH3 domain-containing protein n=1 Tax=Gemmobacter fulvus TaxID=2840474 RepID=A0A975P5B9_9RHOB|nr:SH3 domain-containing protein [Gemmobacter fulvus]MBT9245859.1 SH3 domain-containing protein [Gemmobacter fulvus]QWK89308.1 SH3 domain-containing protein [Gemmobacter fulvus]
MIRAALLILGIAAAPATADTLPALFDVSGVSAGDSLNIRAEASSKAPVIGTLARDEKAVELVALSKSGTWGQINAGEATGWVYLKYLSRQPGEDWAQIARTMRCFGTEPFWSLTLSPGAADVRLEQPGMDEVRMALGAHGDGKASFGTDAQGGEIAMVAQACSDGMSDRAFGISMTGTLRPGLNGAAEPAALTGCCTLKP